MVRFQAFDDASDDADLRAKRGAHIVVFEDGDAGPALRAATPFLNWADVEASPALPFAEFADITLRAMTMPRSASRGGLAHSRLPRQPAVT